MLPVGMAYLILAHIKWESTADKLDFSYVKTYYASTFLLIGAEREVCGFHFSSYIIFH